MPVLDEANGAVSSEQNAGLFSLRGCRKAREARLVLLRRASHYRFLLSPDAGKTTWGAVLSFSFYCFLFLLHRFNGCCLNGPTSDRGRLADTAGIMPCNCR
jgi:hypothetical protein